MTELAATPPVHLYQWADSAQPQPPAPGYLTLHDRTRSDITRADPTSSRPAATQTDWGLYAPLLDFLQNEPLQEGAFYGFFTPQFAAHTGWDHARVTGFVQSHAPQTDVFLFSPQADMGAFFLNVFEQAEALDPGFIDALSGFLATQGRTDDLRALVMDSRHVVFCNYLVARPAFWRAWHPLAQALITACEAPGSALRSTAPHAHAHAHAQAQAQAQAQARPLLALERLASLLIHSQTHWRSKAANPFTFALSETPLRLNPMNAVVGDALKIAFRDQGFPEYMAAYGHLRKFQFTAAESAAGAAA